MLNDSAKKKRRNSKILQRLSVNRRDMRHAETAHYIRTDKHQILTLLIARRLMPFAVVARDKPKVLSGSLFAVVVAGLPFGWIAACKSKSHNLK
jgi:hypothetical protein